MTSWVIITSKADLLYDEGYQLAMELLSILENETEQNKKNITYIETNGDHVTGLLFDKEKYSNAVEAVRLHLFSDSLKC
jgi:hypothetical protein